jgi:mannose-6-phosphate isomerase-like protein (cupin superfamily)
MSTPVSISKFEVKPHGTPDELRTPSKTRVEVVHLEGFALGRFILQPGWRWSECIKPVVNTDSCQNSHVGYAVSGRLVVTTKDGATKHIGPGDAYTIPPGHDAWVEGSEPFVCIEIMSAEQFAKPHTH